MTDLATMLKNGLPEAGLTLVTPIAPELSGGVCVAEVRSNRRRELVDTLYGEHGIAGAGTGGLRLCAHFYNTREHVERAIRAVKTLASSVA